MTYRFLNAESTAVVHIPTSRCIYLEQPSTIHTEAYIKWRDGWTEVIPATDDTLEQTIIHEPHTADVYIAPPAPTAEQIKAREVAKAQADLSALDLKSIRALREYIAAKPDAPAFIKQHETDAAALRGKLK